MATQPETTYGSLWPQRHERPSGDLAVLERMLDRQPKLPGALCRGRWDLFDADNLDQAAQAAHALEVCEQCPALQACTAWADSGNVKPVGILAGRWYLDDRTGCQARRLQAPS